MSTPVRRVVKEPISPEAVSMKAKSHLEISVAVKNKNGKWEKPRLKTEEIRSLQTAIETIRRQGQSVRGGVWQKFNEEGAVLQVTSEGIFIKEGRRWKNLLSDPNVDAKTREEVKKTLQTVSSVVGELSTAKTKFVAEKEQQAHLVGLQGNIAIEVHVTPPKRFNERLMEERKVHQSITALQDSVLKSSSFFQTRGISNEHVSRLQARVSALTKASQELLEILESTGKLLNDFKTKEGVIYYANNILEKYGAYCDSMREWQLEQRILTHILGPQHSLQIDILHPSYHETVAKELFFFAEKEIPRQVDTVETLEIITRLHAGYIHYGQLQKTVTAKTLGLIEDEKQFNQQVTQAITALTNPHFIEVMQKEGWKEGEIADYYVKLGLLKDESDATLLILEKTQEFVYAGDIQGALDYYCDQLPTRYQRYALACEELIVPQTLAQGRTLGQKLQPFSLNLGRPWVYETFLTEMVNEIAEAPILDRNLTKVIDEERWADSLGGIKSISGSLVSHLSAYPYIKERLNQYHAKNIAFANQLGEFVHHYQGNRELFESIMRRHGISDVESAYIFNHYEAVRTTFEEWNGQLQGVVDLVNQKKYPEAAEKYGQFMQTQFPRLLSVLRRANLNLAKLHNPQVKAGFLEFAAQVGLKNGQEMFRNLSLEQWIKLPTDEFEAFIDTGAREGVFDRADLPQSIEQAYVTATSELQRVYQTRSAFEHSFTQEGGFIPFFSKLYNAIAPEEWNRIQETHGFSFELVETFDRLSNQYARVLQPLKEAEAAISTETNPQKKRALKAQLKELVRNKMPEVQKLHLAMINLGGFDKLTSIVDNAAHDVAAKRSDLAGDIQATAKDVLDLMRERTSYFDKLFENLGFFSTWELGSVERSLVTNHQGLTDKEARWLSNWCDKYMQESFPLLNAHKELQADPFNPVLQQELKRIAKKQIPELNRLRDEFTEKMGIARLRSLEQAIPNLRMAERISQTDKAISAADWAFGHPMSWDLSYLTLLVSKRVNDSHIWKNLLTNNELKFDDVRVLVDLYREYQTEMLKMVELERKLEAHPENGRLRSEIKKEMVSRLEKLESLKKAYDTYSAKIPKLQQVLASYLKELKKLEGLDRDAVQQPVLLTQADLQRKQVGGFSKEELPELIKLSETINIEQAFKDMRTAIDDTYSRFERRV